MTDEPHFEECDREVRDLVLEYVCHLKLPVDKLRVTTSRTMYRDWIGRLVPPSYGGAYCFTQRGGYHAILVNLSMIDQGAPRSVEIVVAEELMHMRDHLDGDRRRHSHHGHDRIARRVATLVGVTLEEVRAALLPPRHRPYRYLYRCPGCGLTVPRRRKGTWSCRRCSPRFDRRFVLRVMEELRAQD